MALTLLSESEKLFIINGIQVNKRLDCRGNRDYRTIEIETDIFPHCNGSSVIKLGNTMLLTGVKAELVAPKQSMPNRGWIEITIDSTPSTPQDFDNKAQEEFMSEISQLLTQTCNNNKLINLESLCVIPGQQVWVLYVDIMVTSFGGNFIDAASLATKAALFDTKIQSAKVKSDDEDEPEIEISDDPFDVFSLDVTNLPLLLTLSRVGSEFVLDATVEEAACSICKIVLGISPSDTVLIKKMGSGSAHIASIRDALEIAQEIGSSLQQQLMAALTREKDLPKRKNCLL